ncbi:hypothetical protein ACIHFE_30810 [Streptomyces sp. NPDC052396]|uniref:hypothetical protein n=1 Tax=Streptomyces sp. NPDC052396 TaxID=3365689 RepID=UPI0037CFE32A
MNLRCLPATAGSVLATAALLVLGTPAVSHADSADCHILRSATAPSKLTVTCGVPGPDFPIMKQEVERTTRFVTPALRNLHGCGDLTQRHAFLHFEARDRCPATAHYLTVNGDFWR